MCQKQCRDENGFKCHKLSESHRRQMHIFLENPNQVGVRVRGSGAELGDGLGLGQGLRFESGLGWESLRV